MRGDRIIAVEGEDSQFVETRGPEQPKTADDLLDWIHKLTEHQERIFHLLVGKPGTTVRLKVQRAGKTDTVIYGLKRREQVEGPQHYEPLLSLFAVGNDWVAWCPEGYYACSPEGENLIAWQVHKKPGELPSVFPASQFHKTMYRPDVIKLLLRKGSVDVALTEADLAMGKVTKKTEVGKVLPPAVFVTSPKENAKLGKGRCSIEAIAQSVGEHPVTAFRLLVDGSPQGNPKRVQDPKLGQVEDKWTLELAPGKHEIQVLADSAVSQGKSPVVTVVRPTNEELRPRLLVLAIGAGTFKNGDVKKLRKAGDDARAIVKTFKNHSSNLFREVVVKELTEEDATHEKILDALQWFGGEMKAQDVAVFFFAGHGKRDKIGQLYLYGHDTDPKRLGSTGVPGSQVMSTMMKMAEKGRVLLFLDACHSGALEEGVASRDGNTSIHDELALDLGLIENGLVVFCSCRGNEESLEDPTDGGFFTQAVVEGLSGKAQKVEGAIYLHHLRGYVADRVKVLSKSKQTPILKIPEGITRLPLSKP